MATADQIKSLIRSYAAEDRERFYSIALQVAAHEAKKGHTNLAHEIREIIDASKSSIKQANSNVIPISADLKGLLATETANIPLSSLVLPEKTLARFKRLIKEFYQRDKLLQHGLTNRRRVLLAGPPGTGKTMSAKVLAHELKLPLYTIQVDRMVTKFMGETSAKLRQVFEVMQLQQGVYFFDEFDALGGDRSLDNDVGEMRRVLNALLQFIEQDQSNSIIVAATNNPKLLDKALFRRFDDVLSFSLPDEADTRRLIKLILGVFLPTKFSWDEVLASSKGLSHAEIRSACQDTLKDAVLFDQEEISDTALISNLKQRQKAYMWE